MVDGLRIDNLFVLNNLKGEFSFRESADIILQINPLVFVVTFNVKRFVVFFDSDFHFVSHFLSYFYVDERVIGHKNGSSEVVSHIAARIG